MRVAVDRDLCQGHGMCVLEAGTVFSLAKGDAQVVILQEHPSEDLRADVERAVRYCPTTALTVVD